ncbi:ATP-binding protein [Uliginosibacterium sp. sgz301328]|uniref:HAMP domain-containing sensor histidine kinase n=1 Tax=Uliginosibacterium sp. sgz301328 TaxID=3243764 RepID=UPI00359E8E61
MGRLFWRFLLWFWLAQLASVLGVGIAMWVRSPSFAQQQGSESTTMRAVTNALQAGGVPALARLQDNWRAAGRPLPLVLDRSGRDVLGRPVPEDLPPPPDWQARMQNVRVGNDEYRILPRPGPGMRGAHPRAHHWYELPPEPLIAGAVVSLIFAGILAWHYWRPIRSLRTAFRETARGALSVRLGPTLGRRRDEFGELSLEFDIMADKIGNLMDGQRRLLHDVSHELRSPLARMQAAADVLRQRPQEASELADRFDQELMRMDTLIDGLLTLSRLEAGVVDAMDENVSLTGLIAGIVEDARFEAGAAAHGITLRTAPSLVARGNGELLHRALENIVRNALLHTTGAVHVSLTQEGHRAVLIVDDEGPGIPLERREAVFAPFYRQGRADAPRGHGLGLAIARRIFAAHGGDIALLDRPGGTGLRVRVHLPLAGAA